MEESKRLTLASEMVERQLRARGIADPRVLQAMLCVPRDAFVRDSDRDLAYNDRALPTAEDQTISQPYIVAIMTELLAVTPGHRVLEIGAGSGYQAAILAYLGARVTSVERRAALAASARRTLETLGYGGSVDVVEGDGTLGWAPGAPYDRILVTAAAPHVPRALEDQCAADGRILIPLGDRESQTLTLITRSEGRWQQKPVIGCRFVPLIGSDAWAE